MVVARSGPAAPYHLWILHGAFLMSLVVYFLVGLAIRSTRPTPDPIVAPERVLSMLLLGFGLLALALSALVPRFLPEPPAGPTGPTAAAFLSSRVTRLVVTDALLEAPGVLAFVNFLIGTELWVSLALLASSFAGLALMVPRLNDWLGEYDRLRRATPPSPVR